MDGAWATRQSASAADTIFALSTPLGRSAVAVIRVSGPRAADVLPRMAGRCPAPRQATFAIFRDPATKTVLDEGLALFFRGPASFTGEDCAELQVHGSTAAIQAVLRALATLPGLREARAGEFTRRALANGKLDLARTEALADLIEAQTERQRRLAVRAMAEGPAQLADEWRRAIVDCAAEIEARLDFADEGDVDLLQSASLRARILAVAAQVAKAIRDARQATRIREGFVVAICGPPNAGKSTLLNALTGRDHAIVSPHAGTTRDTIEVCLDLRGVPVTFCDTAGIRPTADELERLGIERARLAARRADLTIWLEAPDARGEPDGELTIDLRIASKADLGPSTGDMHSVSAQTGAGIDTLLAVVASRAAGEQDEFGDAITLRERHLKTAGGMQADLTAAASAVEHGQLEIAAAHLSGALALIASLGSKTASEDVLDQVFGRFCIGK